ncbi:NAD(P)H-flavin reductase [Reinekea marinisedimentorum]|uniref:NAD(P)H-flavin reductase n=1 Tax=Reinekea marinisedimentorum TaxID=230495 RepID=UPI0014047953|nr:NAD(P)H-flavin reductase [Reinekea marinisedimentorum]
MATTSATVHDIQQLSGNVWRVHLKPLSKYPFKAGQYTELVIEGFSYLYFTIASSPKQPCIELHIQGGSETSDNLIAYLQREDTVELNPASGNCSLDKLAESNSPLLLIASGTGFAQVKAIVEDLIHQRSKRPTYIYWTSYNLSHLYMLKKAEQWAEDFTNIHTTALISEQSHWDDKHKLLVHGIFADHEDDLAQCQAVTCGSPEMVYAVYDMLTAKGFKADHMISDVFDFAPRESK